MVIEYSMLLSLSVASALLGAAFIAPITLYSAALDMAIAQASNAIGNNHVRACACRAPEAAWRAELQWQTDPGGCTRQPAKVHRSSANRGSTSC
jgi:hypothetical protein